MLVLQVVLQVIAKQQDVQQEIVVQDLACM
jgi:hypothetical protein